MLSCIFGVFLLLTQCIYAYEYPFSTSGSTVLDAKGTAVRMRCVNWPGTMETLMPEGLQHNSIENIVVLIKQMNMTCVRLTYSIDVTLQANVTAYQSLSRLQLTSALQGFQENNPSLLNSSVSSIFDAVLDTLGRYNVSVLFDNHISKAMWCCSNDDGNGFWGDEYFNVDQWLSGVRFMAQKTLNRPFIVAMSLRNELRGPRQNEADWYRYVVQGITEAIAFVNPKLLVVVSGLNYDTNLRFIQSKPIQDLVPQSIRNKIVYEGHWYSWSGYGPADDCDKTKQGVQNAWGFISQANQSYTAPVWLTEFGTNVDDFKGDDSFIDCVKSFLQTPTTNQISWFYWVLAGTYYQRDGRPDVHESFGLLTDDWKNIKSQAFINVLSNM